MLYVKFAVVDTFLKMRKYSVLLLIYFADILCHGRQLIPATKTITVSIAPFKYFVEAIAGNDFTVNIMVPAGADPHIYEPFPEQITNAEKISSLYQQRLSWI